MAASVLDVLNMVRVVTATVGTADFVCGAAYSSAFMTEVEAGAVDGKQYSYVITDNAGGDIEEGWGPYTASTRTIARNVVKSKIGGSAGTTKLTLSGSATVRITPLARDLQPLLQTPIVADVAQSLTPAQQVQARANVSACVKGQLFGLTLANNGSDATNDIDIAAGEAASTETNPVLMVLASALTKQLDAAWAVGNNAGGRMSAAAIADTTYHVWIIQRSDTGVVDVGFDVSATAPTMPANYDRKRLIGSIVRVSGAIKAFVQDGDVFRWLAPVLDINVANPGTSAVTRTLTLPTGRRLQADLVVGYNDTGSNGPDSVYISDLSMTDTAASIGNGTVTIRLNGTAYVSGTTAGLAPASVMTNTSAQVRSRLQTSAATTALTIITRGWTDRRGQDS